MRVSRNQEFIDCDSAVKRKTVKYVDLFCGIGGFRVAMEQVCGKLGVEAECVFSSDIDKYCQDSYEGNFGHRPVGDITKVDEHEVPDHDVLFGGFPCQPFSIIGRMRGLHDTRGTLFFDIARILEAKQPRLFVLENVKQLVGHDGGKTLAVIMETLQKLGYNARFKVLNALDYGLPQKRERVVIVGSRGDLNFEFPTPQGEFKPLQEILESEVDKKYFASEHIRNKRIARHTSTIFPSIWHENKSGNVTSYPFSCALRAGASYNYLLVNGERRLTPREMLRLQGFPDSYRIVVSDGQLRKQAGNAVPVDMIRAVLGQFSSEFIALSRGEVQTALAVAS